MELHDVIGIGVALGIDCLVVSAAIATLRPTYKTILFTCFMFGLFQSGMAYAGMMGGAGLARLFDSPLRLAPPLLLCAVGILMMVGGHRRAGESAGGLGAVAIVGAAVSVSLDALGAGAAMGLAGIVSPASAAVIGLISVAMSGVGFAGGAALARRAEAAERVGGLILIGLAVVMFVTSL